MILIIDYREKSSRVQTLATICQDLIGAGGVVRVVREVWGTESLGQGTKEKCLEAFDRVSQGAGLVLLHSGTEQNLAAEALGRIPNLPCIAYSAGDEPAGGVGLYFQKNRSEKHGLIPEMVPVDLEPDSDAAKKLRGCLHLILTHNYKPPEAIEKVYGDPELERILNGLYSVLTSGEKNCIEDLRKKRDEDLQRYYAKKRGW